MLNFFTDQASANAWLAANPTVSGVVLDQAEALHTGVETFGRLLDE